MAEYEITCVERPQKSTHPVHIVSIGGPACGVLTLAEAIERMGPLDNGDCTSNCDRFYTAGPFGRRDYLYVVNGNTRRYLRTTPDDTEDDNLLHLSPCEPR